MDEERMENMETMTTAEFADGQIVTTEGNEEDPEGIPGLVYAVAFGVGVVTYKVAKGVIKLISGKKPVEIDHGKFTRIDK